MQFLIIMVLMLGVMYVLMIRPQRQRQAQQQSMVDSASGDPLAARRQLEESLHLCRSLGDQHTTAVALQLLGSVERDLGNTDRAKQLLGESVELLRSHGTAARLGAAIHGLGDVFLDEKAFE